MAQNSEDTFAADRRVREAFDKMVAEADYVAFLAEHALPGGLADSDIRQKLMALQSLARELLAQLNHLDRATIVGGLEQYQAEDR